MDTKKDIETRADIQRAVEWFYEKVKADEHLGIIFNEIVDMHWDTHIPLIVDFWETILLDNPVYQKNAMEKHFHLNHIYPLKKVHFDAWLKHFHAAFDDYFEGPITELAKKRADSIAAIMQFKMEERTKKSM
jgi:hemoglobin